MEMLSSQEVPLCFLALRIVCRRSSWRWRLQAWRFVFHCSAVVSNLRSDGLVIFDRLRLLPLRNANIPSGLVAPFWLLSVPSRTYGALKKSMTSVAPRSFTAVSVLWNRLLLWLTWCDDLLRMFLIASRERMNVYNLNCVLIFEYVLQRVTASIIVSTKWLISYSLSFHWTRQYKIWHNWMVL